VFLYVNVKTGSICYMFADLSLEALNRDSSLELLFS
jgi:hypothetical protein